MFEISQQGALFQQHLVSVEELSAQISHPDLVIIHTQMPMVGQGDIPQNVGAIPGAVSLNVDTQLSDTQNTKPHSLLSDAEFCACMQRAGVSDSSVVVIYDDYGLYSAPRLWFLLKAMGHSNVHLLNGGMPAWQQAGLAIVSAFRSDPARGNFSGTLDTSVFISAATLLKEINHHKVTTVDARSAERFYGKVPEPRPGLRQGHIPGAVNIPFQDCLENGKLHSVEALTELFSTQGLTPDKPLVFSCGSGVTACIPLLAALVCGFNQLQLYDGSWSEWGADSTLPIE